MSCLVRLPQTHRLRGPWRPWPPKVKRSRSLREWPRPCAIAPFQCARVTRVSSIPLEPARAARKLSMCRQRQLLSSPALACPSQNMVHERRHRFAEVLTCLRHWALTLLPHPKRSSTASTSTGSVSFLRHSFTEQPLVSLIFGASWASAPPSICWVL